MSDKKFLANYRGEVVRNNDPLGASRVKINIFGVYDGFSEEDIPWSIYADPTMYGGNDSGSSFIPDVGDHVWCFFEQGDPEYPVYFAGAPARPHGPDEGRPDNRVIKTKAGHLIELDDTEGSTRIKIKHGNGTEVEFDHEGNKTESITNNKTSEVSGDQTETIVGDLSVEVTEGGVSVQVQGNVNLDIEGDVKVEAPTIQLGEDGQVEPSVLGDQLASWIESTLKVYLDNHTHMVTAIASPTGPAMASPYGPFVPNDSSIYSSNNTNQ